MRSPETISINEESHQVPSWSIWAAALTFVLLESYLWLTSSAQPHRLPLGLRINFNLSWGLLLALYIVMVGFVSVDAPRRAMSMQLWILICFIMPGGIGAVLYFLLRQPEVSRCSGCEHSCRMISISVRSAILGFRPVAELASVACVSPTNSVPAVAAI